MQRYRLHADSRLVIDAATALVLLDGRLALHPVAEKTLRKLFFELHLCGCCCDCRVETVEARGS